MSVNESERISDYIKSLEQQLAECRAAREHVETEAANPREMCRACGGTGVVWG